MEEKKITGRPTKYKPEYCEEVRNLFLLGYTVDEVCLSLGVAEPTYRDWLKKYPDFSRAVKEGKESADAKVAASLYKRAIGFVFQEVTREGFAHKKDKIKDAEESDDEEAEFEQESEGDAIDRMAITKVVTKYIPPDTGAIMNWLKNRQPGKWRDKQVIEHEGTIKTQDLSNLTDEELTALIAKLEKNGK